MHEWEDPRNCSEAVDGFREMRSYLTSFQGFKLIYVRRNAKRFRRKNVGEKSLNMCSAIMEKA